MIRIRRIEIGISVFIGVLFLGAVSTAHALTIVHTNDVLGEIEPCGCRKNPQGGMARKANLLKKIKDPFVLQLDAGDLLFPTDKIPELLAGQSQLQAEYLLKSMDLLQHDAVVPGEKEFSLGVKIFENLLKKTKIKFLAANLTRKNGKKFLEPSAVFTGKDAEGNTVRVGVIGLVGKQLQWPKELKVLNAIEIAKKEVSFLRKKTDYIVALTHQGLEEDVRLAKKVKGIDFIIGAHSQSFLQTPAKFGDCVILQSSFRNQYVGILPVKKPLVLDDYQLTGLDASYDSPAQAPSAMDDLVTQFKTAIADYNSKHETMLTESVQYGSGQADDYQTFPKCAQCHIAQFNFWRKTEHVSAYETLVKKQQAKNKECLQCHTVGLGSPQGFSDVNVLAEVSGVNGAKDQALPSEDLQTFLKAMAKAKSVREPVKLMRDDKEARPMLQALSIIKKSWTPVQCENCHKPGGNHPFSAQYSKKVEKETCLNCHTAERAPSWYKSSGQPNLELIEKKKKEVTCPAGDFVESEE